MTVAVSSLVPLERGWKRGGEAAGSRSAQAMRNAVETARGWTVLAHVQAWPRPQRL